jgi:3-oxoadipate enol-lactonase/4-carboxymuconolactone decarboxylase
MLRLAPAIGRDEAHALTERLVADCGADRALPDAAAADPRVSAHLDAAALAEVFDPATYLGSAAAFIERTLGGRSLAPALAPRESEQKRGRTLPPLARGEGEGSLYERGLAVRRQVLGDAWVDASLAARDSFTGEFQDFITRIAWGEIWTRPGLDRRTRRLLVAVITAALGRWEEFALHARAGFEQDGFTADELKEALMQSAIYAGVPAANTGFKVARQILKELGRL